MDGPAQRRALDALVRDSGLSLAALSRDLLGRNVAYLQQFIARGSPRMLGERERRLLADYLGVDQGVLGGPPGDTTVTVPRLAIGAAAGAGRIVGDGVARRSEPFSRALLDRLGVAPAAASMIRVDGDSMAPTLLDGDTILVDGGDTRVPPRGGLFVVRIDDALMVKRVVPDGDALRVVSDNPASPAPGRLPRDAVAVIGRVAWLSREPR